MMDSLEISVLKIPLLYFSAYNRLRFHVSVYMTIGLLIWHWQIQSSYVAVL